MQIIIPLYAILKQNANGCKSCGLACQKGSPFQMICGMKLSKREHRFASNLFATAKIISESNLPTASIIEMLQSFHPETYEKIISNKLTKKERQILHRVLAAEIQCSTSYDPHLLNHDRIKAINERILNQHADEEIEYF